MGKGTAKKSKLFSTYLVRSYYIVLKKSCPNYENQAEKSKIRLDKAIIRLDKAIIRLKNQDSLSENLLNPVVKGRNAGHLSGPIVSASERIGILSPEASHHLPEIIYR